MFILASQSPRRHHLLAAAGYTFVVRVPDVDEAPLLSESAGDMVRRLAIIKAQACHDPSLAPVSLGADTTVFIDPFNSLGKPDHADHAIAMLSSLSGRRHWVSTAVAVVSTTRLASIVVTSCVQFRTLSDSEIRAYVASGEPLDRAGAYAIQGGAGHFVQHVAGSWTSIVGLPMAETSALLASFQLTPE